MTVEVELKSINCKMLPTVLAASLFLFYSLCLFSLMNVLSIYLQRDLHFSAADISIIASCHLWGGAAGFIPLGFLLDKYRPRAVGLPLLLLAVLGNIFMMIAESMWFWCLLQFMQGLASAASLLILMRVVTSFKHTNRAFGIIMLSALIGGMVGNSLYAEVSSYVGWRTGLIFIASLGGICFIIMEACLYEEDFHPLAALRWQHLLRPAYLLAGLHLALLSAPVFILGSLFGNQYLIQHANVSLSAASGLSSLIFAGMVAGSLVLRYFAVKYGYKKILAAAYLGLAFCMLLLAYTEYDTIYDFPMIFIMLGMFACTVKLIYPLICKPHSVLRSTAAGITALVASALGALMQMESGVVIDKFGMHSDLLFLFMFGLFVLGLCMLPVFYLQVQKSGV